VAQELEALFELARNNPCHSNSRQAGEHRVKIGRAPPRTNKAAVWRGLEFARCRVAPATDTATTRQARVPREPGLCVITSRWDRNCSQSDYFANSNNTITRFCRDLQQSCERIRASVVRTVPSLATRDGESSSFPEEDCTGARLQKPSSDRKSTA